MSVVKDSGPKEAETDPAALKTLVDLRRKLTEARPGAASPAIARALQMADYYLFLGMTYLGYVDKLFPEEE
jgi:hypothetical protein